MKRIFSLLLLMLPAAAAALAQIDLQLRVGRQPGWDPEAREGRCEVRVWVDHSAELRLRGDNIFVRTLEGGRSYDEGSSCSSPIPYNAVGNFELRQRSGRNRVNLRQEPDRRNNFTAFITINDDQGGGDHYSFDVSWRGDGNRSNDGPAPFFDDIRACQDSVRQRFLSRNERSAYLDFNGSADRRDLTYTCVVESRTGRVRSTDYKYENAGGRGRDRARFR